MTVLRLIKLPNIGQKYEYLLNAPVIFSLLVIFQGIFGGNSIKIIPEKLLKLFENPWFRIMGIFLIAYTATLEIEMAVLSTVIFTVFINLLRTEEERKQFPLGF